MKNFVQMKLLTLVICSFFLFESIYFRGKLKFLLSGNIVLNNFFFLIIGHKYRTRKAYKKSSIFSTYPSYFMFGYIKRTHMIYHYLNVSFV